MPLQLDMPLQLFWLTAGAAGIVVSVVPCVAQPARNIEAAAAAMIKLRVELLIVIYPQLKSIEQNCP